MQSREAIGKIPLFSNLDNDHLDKIASVTKLSHFKEEEMILMRGEMNAKFYIIVSGQVLLTDITQELNQADMGVSSIELGPDDYFGERALMYKEPTSATAVALSDVTCMTLDRDNFEILLGPLLQLLSFNLVMRAMQNVPLLNPLTKATLEAVQGLLKEETFPAGALVIEKSQTCKCLYIVKEGEMMNDPGEDMGDDGNALSWSMQNKLLTITVGGYFGEKALEEDNYVATSTVFAMKDTVVYALYKTDFDGLEKVVTPVSRKKSSIHKATLQRVSQVKSVALLDDFDHLCTIGAGSFGKVKLVQSRSNDKVFALKMLRKALLIRHKQENNVANERRLLQMVNHPFILKMYTTFQDEKHIYFLLEMVQGGELFSLIHSGQGYLPVECAKFYAACIVSGLGYLHEKFIVYRDLKPENVLLDKNGYCKIVDFGFAKIVKDATFTLCGTTEYLAPELIVGKGHSKGVDYWALGILLFEMIVGYSPFFDKNGDQVAICKNVLRSSPVFPGEVTDTDAIDLIERLLTKDVNARIGCLKGGTNDIKKHPFFAGIDWLELEARRADDLVPWVPPLRDELDNICFQSYDEIDESEDDFIDEEHDDVFVEF